MSKHKSRSSSKNYRTEEFVMFIMSAEVGIQEAATLVPAIRDGDVTNALDRLLRWLETHSALPQITVGEVKDGILTIDADKVNPRDLIAARIVNNWYIAMEEYGERSNADLAGCLRVILDSVRTWTRGPKSRGYLAYAAEFLKKSGVEMKLVPADEHGKPSTASAAMLPPPPPALDDLSLEDLTARWLEQPLDDEVFDAFLHRARYYLASGRGEELIAHLKPLIAQAKTDTQRARMLWVLGRAHLKLEQGLAAVDPLRRAVNLEARFIEAWLALAEAYQAIGSHHAAAHAWEQVRALDRKRVEIYPPLAATYRALGDVASEIATWERFAATAGRSLFARYALAQAYRRVKRENDAAREWARVRKLEPATRGASPADWAVWLRMQVEAGRLNQSDTMLERAQRREPAANWFIPLIALAAAEIRNDAQAAQNAFDRIESQNEPWDAARREIEPILRDVLPPTSRLLQSLRADAPTLHLTLGERKRRFADERAFERANELTNEGNRHLQRHDYAAAERAFRRALEFSEGDAMLFGLGLVCAMTDRTEEAFHCFNRAVEIYAEDADFWYNLGMAAMRTFRISRALQAFERCLELGVERDLQRQIEERIRILRQGVAELQTEWGKSFSREEMIRHEDLFARGVAAMEQGENTRAIELFREAVTVNERHHQSWGNLGACLLQRGDLDEGEQALRRALAIKPDYEFARFNLESLAVARASGAKPELPMLISNKPHFKPPGLRFHA